MRFSTRNILVWLFVSLLISPVAFAKIKEVAVVDAGSSHTELFIYRFIANESKRVIPTDMQIVAQADVSQGISAYANHPEEVKRIFEQLLTAAPEFNQKHLPIYILGTGGMRLLGEEQANAIYCEIKHYIEANTSYSIQAVSTIRGEEEAAYDWIAVNFLMHTLDKPMTETFGVLDMGGASTEIAFASRGDYKKNPNAVESFLTAHSLLPLGQNEAFKRINDPSCYPTDYLLPDGRVGQFSYEQCKIAIDEFFKSKAVPVMNTQTAAGAHQFVALSGYFYAYQFFNQLNSPEKLEGAVKNECGLHWPEFVSSHPEIAEKYLVSECFNGVYINEMMQTVFQDLPKHARLSIVLDIEGKKVNWTLGAAIQSCLKN